MPDEAPKQVDDLALALLLSRLDTQDKVAESTLKEVRKTNGTVRDLQARVNILERQRLDLRVTAIEQEGAVHVGQADIVSRARERHHARLILLAQIGVALVAFAELGHALAWW